MEISNWFVPNIGDQRGAKWGGGGSKYKLQLVLDYVMILIV